MLLGSEDNFTRKINLTFRSNVKFSKTKVFEKEISNSPSPNQPSLLQEIRKAKYESTTAKKDSSVKTKIFLENAEKQSNRLKFVKCGNSLDNYAKFPSLSDMLEWIKKELNCSDEILIQRMIKFVKDLRNYESELDYERKYS